MYKIKDESEHHYEIETPEGNSFHVAKEGLSPQMHDNLRKMCEGGMAHYDDGGEVPDGGEEAAIEAEAAPLPQEQPPMMQQQQVPVTPQQPAPIPTAPTSPEVANQYAQAIENEREGFKKQEVAASQLGRAQAGVLKEQVTNAQDALQEHNAAEQQRFEDQRKLGQEIAQAKIDPKQYFNNLSTAGKISTVLGLVLGGIGAGGSGGGVNQAVNVLNDQIRADIDAQKANIENKNSLYAKNFEQTRDERQAYLLTASQQLSIAQAKLAQEAAKNQTPQANAAFQLASAALDKQQAAISQQLFIANLQNKIATGGKFDANLAPFAKNPAAIVSLGDGTAIQASSPQGAAKVQEIIGKHKPAIDTIDRLEELAVNPIRPASPEYQRAKSLTATLLTQLKGASGLGRLSPEAIKLLEQSYNNPLELKEIILHDERTKALKQSLKEQMDAQIAPYLPSYRARSSIGFKPGLNGKQR